MQIFQQNLFLSQSMKIFKKPKYAIHFNRMRSRKIFKEFKKDDLLRKYANISEHAWSEGKFENLRSIFIFITQLFSYFNKSSQMQQFHNQPSLVLLSFQLKS